MRKLAIVAFSFAAAIFCANLLLLERSWLPAGGVLLLLTFPVWRMERGYSRRRALAAVLCLGGLGIGFLWMTVYTDLFVHPAEKLDDQTIRMEATILEWPTEEEYGWSVPVRAKTESVVSVTAILYTDEQGEDLCPGDRIETVAHCVVGSRTFSGEEITYYTSKGVFLRAKAYGELKAERSELISPRYWPALLAKELKESIDRNFPGDVAPLVRALVTGNRERLTDTFTSSLQRTGLSHTVAVSGMHLAFISGLLNVLLGRGRRSTALVTVVWVFLFCAVAGNTPSVLRAAVMILMLQIAPLFNRERDNPTALGFALMLLLLWNPYSAAHIGLQLSFGAVAGIMLVSEPFQERVLELFKLNRYVKNRLLRWLLLIPRFFVSTLTTTLGASVFTVPLVAVHFQMFSLISPLSNLLTLWAVAILFVGGLGVGILGLFAANSASWAAGVFAPLGRYLNWIIDRLGKIPLASIPVDSVYYRGWILFLCALIGVTFAVRGKKRMVTPICCAVIGLAASMLFTAWTFQSGELTVAALDVGQGQSVLIRADHYLTLVDCGGDGPDNAGDVAADYLHSLGRTSLDLLVVSHYHSDHANGIPQLMKRINVSAIALPDVEPGDPLRDEILALAEDRGTEVWFIREDTRIALGENQILRLYPPKGNGEETNELGLTVLASCGSHDVLLTGDMGSDGERALMEYALLPDIELLIVGHHGSKYSTGETFLQELRPETAIISVSAENRYGHPAAETLERLERQGVDVYRTDLQGTVVIRYRIEAMTDK